MKAAFSPISKNTATLKYDLARSLLARRDLARSLGDFILVEYTITLIPGDGIGPEVTAATRKVLEATGVKFNWEIAEAGAGVMAAQGTPLPDSVIESVRRNKVALKGPVTTPVGTGFRSVNVAMRKRLDLYACLRPCKTYPGVPSLYKNIDIVVVRENTEDLYAGIEYEKSTPDAARLLKLVMETRGPVREDSGISLKIISEFGSRRIVKYAFDYARENQRKKVTAVHKANIMKFSDGLFLSVAREIAKDYPDIEFNDVIIDNLCMQLVRNPRQFDVLVLPNLYGDIVSDLCAGLVGGLGVAPGANLGEGLAIFEPTHGSAPKYCGQNRVNPMATMFSGMLLLRYLKEFAAADRLEMALAAVIAEGRDVTYDMKMDKSGGVGTSRVADAVIEKLVHD
jgi:isocitrate dehydrogenase (NAD+)